MFELFSRGRYLVDPHRLRREATRRRRLIAASLAGLGVLLVIAALRPSTPALPTDSSTVVMLTDAQVAVPVLIRPAAVASALAPGMVVDVVDPNGSRTLLVERARVLRLPGGGFGPTSEAVAVLAVPESEGIALASAASAGVGVIIRATDQ